MNEISVRVRMMNDEEDVAVDPINTDWILEAARRSEEALHRVEARLAIGLTDADQRRVQRMSTRTPAMSQEIRDRLHDRRFNCIDLTGDDEVPSHPESEQSLHERQLQASAVAIASMETMRAMGRGLAPPLRGANAESSTVLMPQGSREEPVHKHRVKTLAG